MSLKRFRVNPKHFSFDDHDPEFTDGLKHNDVTGKLEEDIETMADLQERLYAERRHSVLIVLQARDAAGKDSTIKHVFSGLNPSGCDVFSYKSPNAHELDHGYLWRHFRDLPQRGHIGIFNRSYYEEVVAVRVHEEFLHAQRLPQELITNDIWDRRFAEINSFEQYLTQNGTRVVKVFLNVSKKEQRKRFLERIHDPRKHWKFSTSDLEERELWKEYDHAFEEMFVRTSTEHAPWYVVPADHKWYTRHVVAQIINSVLEDINPQFPPVTPQQVDAIEKARAALEKD
ncbi:MAG: polyphosphate kinase 2 family protein [Candidatus Poribacteria bacterium]|nr:polyphosphate kinase 2 family protein [Candidatus Poribacteria bacterium]